MRPKGERACEKRSLQMGQAKKLRLKRAEGKGWGVFADEQVGGVVAVEEGGGGGGVVVAVVGGRRRSTGRGVSWSSLTLTLTLTAEQIIEGDFVIEYVGEYISQDEARRRAELSPLAGDYMMELPGRGGGGGGAHVVTIDAYAMRNVAACIDF